MRKLVYILIFLTGIANAQIVNIPDANFKARLIYVGVDTNFDSQIQNSEAEAITSLIIGDLTLNDDSDDIINLSGIEYFLNLTVLNCNSHKINNLSLLNSLSQLFSLDCANQGSVLTNLDVSSLINLTHLNCEQNSLANLNLNGLNQLVDFRCDYNQLTSLNLSGLTALQNASCTFNALTTLDLTVLSNLNNINFSNNNISTLILSGNSSLAYVYANHNNFTSINLSSLTNLQYLDRRQ